MLVRAKTIREVGLLDESYFMYVEEVDWCRRIQQAGWQVWCEPRAHVVHHEAQATRQYQHAMYVAKWRSRLHYFRKFHSPLYLTLLAVIIRFGLWSERFKVKREPLANDERLRRLDAVARQVRPQLLHAHSPVLNAIPALRVGRRLGIPVLYEVRAFWEDAAVDHGRTREGAPRYRLTRALETYAAAALGTGGTELPAAVRASRQLIRLVPLRESGYIDVRPIWPM